MTNAKRVLFSWSGGKDSAMCLHQVLTNGGYEVAGLLTTLNSIYRRVSMHGVREELLDAQAASIGLPLTKVWVTEGTNEDYERCMAEVLSEARTNGIDTVVFGDIFLEDLRAYREQKLADVGMKAVFPLWKQDTKTLSTFFVKQGFRAITCCVQDLPMGAERAGCELTAGFFDSLPPGVDPCGENGEYHSFCYDGPLFRHPIPFTIGEKLYRPLEINQLDSQSQCRGFWYCDLHSNC